MKVIVVLNFFIVLVNFKMVLVKMFGMIMGRVIVVKMVIWFVFSVSVVCFNFGLIVLIES